ncbi:hypothetical protein RHMOL_Rhmol04G0082000 [Rhododendron molle]|uniref:Uncharacterized protein n=1 Tax=Rhododendron molle TaxID=49168 RepID=A0ACC0NY70_RHOML|nr:hypothetical protein RHMOL_Rhmol04G0082000 [Rhododendron molle]
MQPLCSLLNKHFRRKKEKPHAFAPLTTTTTTTTSSPHLSPPPSHSSRSKQNPNSAAAASHSPPSLPAAYRTAMEALCVTPPESASPATADHLIVIDDGPSSPPVPENTGTETQSISSAADEGKGGDAAAAVKEAADAGDRRKVLLEELCRNVVKLPCESIAEGEICEVSASPAMAEHFICIDGPASPPLPENTSTKIQSISYTANEDRGGDMVADAGDRRKVPPEELFQNVVKLSCKSTAEGGICEVASKLEVFPGSEFRVAYEEACNYGGMVKFGDRPLKEMDNIDMMTLENQEMSKQFPTLMETLVHERDQYMSATLLEVAGEYRSVVAVVGKGHLQGIKKYWKQPVELKRLLQVDMCSQSPVFSAVKLLICHDSPLSSSTIVLLVGGQSHPVVGIGDYNCWWSGIRVWFGGGGLS